MRTRTALIPATLLALLSCATQTTPTGGPKDEKPPRLVRSSPDSAQRNFKGASIELTFSELVRLENPREEIIITPSLGKKTQFKNRDNKVTIEPELPWRENTTYTINFREGVKDVTEGNTAPNLLLAFSTGPDLDTLQIEGIVTHALRETVPEDITIAVYSADTFNIMSHAAEYFTKSNDTTGAFRITNLKQGKYRIYAFDDKNKNLKVESKTEAFAFKSIPIELDTNVTRIALPLVRIDSRPLKLTTVRNQSTTNTIRFTKQLLDYTIKSAPRVVSSFGSDQSEIIAHYPDIDGGPAIDSMQIAFHASDSIGQKVDTTFYIRRSDADKIETAFTSSATEPRLDAETGDLQFEIKFNKPIKSIIPDSLYILSDTATIIPVPIKKPRLDTIRNRLFINERLTITDSLSTPKLHIGVGFLISIDSDSSKADSKQLKITDPSVTAMLLAEVQTKHPHFILQLLDGFDKVIATSIDQKAYTFKNLDPQTAKLRVILDTNANGVWDTANVLTNTESERIVYYKNSEGKFEIPLRANWEVGPLVIRL